MTIPEISVAEARDRLASPQPPRLIDVREEDEWAVARLPGAELLPLSRFPAVAPELLTDKQAPLLLYCHHGMRSAHATAWLLQQGYSDVTNLGGGIDAWSREIDPAVPLY